MATKAMKVMKAIKIVKKKKVGGAFNEYGSEGPSTGNETKQQIAEEIREVINMSSNWVAGLVRADRNSLIALMNCVRVMKNDWMAAEDRWATLQEENEALKAEIAELKASITK